MKIYVVTKGCYSEYHIITATLDEEKAKRIARAFSEPDDVAEVEEYDDGLTDNYVNPVWIVHISIEGEIENCYLAWEDANKSDILPINKWRDFSLSISVRAETKEEAIKIATDKRAQYLAEKAGIC